jgi:hypothetical protein
MHVMQMTYKSDTDWESHRILSTTQQLNSQLTITPIVSCMSQLPLPEGWIQEYDPQQKHPFWVSTPDISYQIGL